jgi:hypothetical protein
MGPELTPPSEMNRFFSSCNSSPFFILDDQWSRGRLRPYRHRTTLAGRERASRGPWPFAIGKRGFPGRSVRWSPYPDAHYIRVISRIVTRDPGAPRASWPVLSHRRRDPCRPSCLHPQRAPLALHHFTWRAHVTHVTWSTTPVLKGPVTIAHIDGVARSVPSGSGSLFGGPFCASIQ